VTLTVRDTGKGIPETASKRTGMGLRIMQYRADAIGAALKIDSARGKGVTVTCVFRSPGIRNGVIP
jgi:signal transduction histidine kinase